jgi:xylulokinase
VGSATLVAGVDSSTQSCKVVVRDAETGQLLRSGTAAHPDGTEVDPEAWWEAFQAASAEAGGLADVGAIAVGGQQHGMVCLDSNGRVVRPALLWNDTRSAGAAEDLIREAGKGDGEAGAHFWAQAVGSVPVAAFTVTKLRWLADHEPEAAAKVAAVALPHDWLTWRIAGGLTLDSLATDRSDASGTGYFDAHTSTYRRDLLALALRDEALAERLVLPRVITPEGPAGSGDSARGWGHLLMGAGCGDNAGAALGLGLTPGQTMVSLGTSGVVASVSDVSCQDASGLVAGFADATGRYLPLACTLNGSRVVEATRGLLGVSHDEFSALALSAQPGAGGLVQVPYLQGERTPNLPHAMGTMRGMTLTSLTRENLARAAVEGLLCLLADGLEAIRRQGVRIEQVSLVGGGARSQAVREIAPAIFGVPVVVPQTSEYVADGAARQAAWVLAATPEPPAWGDPGAETFHAEPDPEVLANYRTAAALEQHRGR